jgi:hypothetical protein
MDSINGYAEQCKDWSEECTACLDSHIAHATAHAWPAAACPQSAGHSRIIDHTVHAVWQTTLPVCDWTWAWAQVLSLGEQSRETPPPYLCASSKSRADSGAIGPAPNLSHALGGAVRHRLRVTHPTGNSVARINGVGQPASGGVSRCDGRQSTRDQHVGTRRKRSALAHTVTGRGTPCARR